MVASGPTSVWDDRISIGTKAQVPTDTNMATIASKFDCFVKTHIPHPRLAQSVFTGLESSDW
ncbi:hypothetical protein [Microseira sp. BLCC-F43]|uniref:hypothetical protein n=1 Tax=Microseira sp. BLCC-F43 TaxID=3153602 RepID=UPI0035B8DAD9